jgi:hypothetical protein
LTTRESRADTRPSFSPSLLHSALVASIFLQLPHDVHACTEFVQQSLRPALLLYLFRVSHCF